MEHNTPKVYTRKELAAVMGCGLSTVDRLLRSGRLRSVKLSPRRIVVTASALEEFLNGESKD